MGWLEKLSREGKELSRVGLIPAYDHFMKFGNQYDEESGLPEIWKVNGEKNIPYLDSIRDRVSSVHTLPKYEHKAIVFIGMAPSLKNSIEGIKKASLSDRYILVATNSSCEYLLKHGIKPHYVILLDGRPGSWTMDYGKDSEGIIAMFGPCAEPDALQSWTGKMMIIPVGLKDRSLSMKIRKRWGKPLPTGGNALNSAFSIFSLLTSAKIMIFVGNDLSFKDTYYGDGRKSKNDESAYFFTIDINGEQVKTLIPLYEYKIWLETIMSQTWPEYHYINCSEGILGIDIDGNLLKFCEHLSMDEAVERVNEAFYIEEMPLESKLKYMYDEFYDHDLGNLQRGKGLWKHVIDNMDFNKGLDVGCGRANGVQYARSVGKDVCGCDISEGAVKCWKERGVDKYCWVSPADHMPFKDGEFDFVLCSEVMEHIPEENVEATLREILRVGSDKFLFTICMVPEHVPLAGIIQSHICLHDEGWWFRKMEDVGFYIISGAVSAEKENLSFMAVKNKEKYKDGDLIFKDDIDNLTIPVIGHTDNPKDGGEYDL